MNQLMPVVKRTYTDYERAVIAGYLLRQREGTLKALSSSKRGAQVAPEIGQEAQLRYYQAAEQYSRFLLYWIGYQVENGAMYAGT